MNDLKQIVKEAIWEANNENPEQIFSIYKAARKLGKDPKTVKRMIETGTLAATADNRHVTQREINNYLKHHPQEPIKRPLLPEQPPVKKLVNIPKGYSALIVETKYIDTIIEATQAADQAEAVEHYFNIIQSAKIINH